MRDGPESGARDKGTRTRSKRDDSYLGNRKDDIANLIRAWNRGSLVKELFPEDEEEFINTSHMPRMIKIYKVSKSREVIKEA